ncbi:hypothetical protein IAT38_000201 [Cryptococcus sp. DSM 104549]
MAATSSSPGSYIGRDPSHPSPHVLSVLPYRLRSDAPALARHHSHCPSPPPTQPQPQAEPQPQPEPQDPPTSSHAETGVPLFPSLARPSRPPTPQSAVDASNPNDPGLPHHNRHTRPHPFLTIPIIYVNSYPPDMPESALADCLKSCLPIRVKMPVAVPPEVRLRPDAYYNWMPRCGTIEFPTLQNAEKALAILADHPFLTPRGIWISPFPPEVPPPMTDSPTTSIFIRQHTLVRPPALPVGATPEQNLQGYFPTPDEVYDVVRGWGAVKVINTWMLQTPGQGSRKAEGEEGGVGKLEWFARVEFWYADEAYRFGEEFVAGGNLIKGWQVVVWSDRPVGAQPMPHPPIPAPAPSPPSLPMISPTSSTGNFFPNTTPSPFPPGAIYPALGLQYIPSTTSIRPAPLNPVPPMAQFPIGPVPLTPQTPTQHDAPPWAGHNPYAYVPPQSPPHTGTNSPSHSHASMSMGINGGRRMSRPSLGQLRGEPGAGLGASVGAGARGGRHRTWSLTVGETPDGALGATGLVVDDGTVIQHGPGQHIRPAPAFGPGSQSASGLVDYSNVFVKNLDPDINSNYLEEIFGRFGQIISARVMRHETGKSRGYGFVSFCTPEQATAAITAMNNVQFGSQTLAVTHHEPRKLRPEKIAERAAAGGGGPVGLHRTPAPVHLRRSTSPLRGAAGGRGVRKSRSGLEEPKAPGTTDEIRLLSPPSRKLALEKRVTARVRHFARKHNLPEGQVHSAVGEIVKGDLEVIPLLYNRGEMEEKIREVVEGLHGGRGGEAGVVSLGSPVPDSPSTHLTNSTSTPAPTTAPRPTESDISHLRTQIEKIDPLDADDVMRVLLRTLTPKDWESGELGSKTGVAVRYGGAKKVVLKEREREGKRVGAGPTGEEKGKSLLSEKAATGSDEQATLESIPLEDLTIPYLASLPAHLIISHLSGPRGPQIKQHLGLTEPTKQLMSSMSWVGRAMAKGPVERKRDIAVVLGRNPQAYGVTRSQCVKLMAEMVNAEEDDQALCDLMLYPALLNAKIQAFLEARRKA